MLQPIGHCLPTEPLPIRAVEAPLGKLRLNLAQVFGPILVFEVGTGCWEVSRQKERAPTSPKTDALAFISVLPRRINDGQY
jgi:hypothetical protein